MRAIRPIKTPADYQAALQEIESLFDATGSTSGRIKSAYTIHNFDQLLLLAGLKHKLDPTQNPDVWRN